MFFDPLLTIGRTNGALPFCPTTETELLRLMDRFDVRAGLVMHTVARDADPELGNGELAGLQSDRLHRIWGYDPAIAIRETPADFVARALACGVRAVMVNPLLRAVRVDRCTRLLQLAELLEQRRLPLLLVYRQWDGGQSTIDWWQVVDFCNRFPALPVICWEWRARANRPLLDALLATGNLRVSLSSVWQAQMVEAITADCGGKGKVVFSLGLPSLDPGSFQAVVNYADIDERERDAIAGGTMQRILNEAIYD